MNLPPLRQILGDIFNFDSLDGCANKQIPFEKCRWSHCKEKFPNVETLTEHVSNDHVKTRQSEYICRWENCPRDSNPFYQRPKIMRHLQTHTGNKPFRCTDCEKSFGESNQLESHKLANCTEKSFKCEECGKWFSSTSTLIVHGRKHRDEKPFECPDESCRKGFSDRSNYAKHVRAHTGDKPYSCTVCPKRFTRSDIKNRHIKTHFYFNNK